MSGPDERRDGASASADTEALLRALDARLGRVEGAESDGGSESGGARALEALRAELVREDPARIASEALRVRRVTNSVLRRSTREDLSRRGDLGLVLDFCMERLRESALLRVAVALLVVQVTLVPLVARMIVQEREEAPILRIELEQRAESLEDALPADALAGGEGLDELAVDSDPIEPILDPFELDSAGAAAAPTAAGLGLLRSALGAGARLVDGAGRLVGSPAGLGCARAAARAGALFRDR
ncbi:MAG: hypothetical protein AAFU73_03195 [Planctomycetota bacterium]